MSAPVTPTDNMQAQVVEPVTTTGWQMSLNRSKDGEKQPSQDLALEIRRLHESLALLYAKVEAQQKSSESSSRSASHPTSRGYSPQVSPKTVPQDMRGYDTPNDALNSGAAVHTPLSPSSSKSSQFSPEEDTRAVPSLHSSSSSKSSALHSHLHSPALAREPTPLPKVTSSQYTDTKGDYEVEYQRSSLADCPTSRSQVIDKLVNTFPDLCEPPARMFGSDGQPLPPTKQQEINDKERAARKAAIGVRNRGIVPHSLLKVTAILETRSVVWKKVRSQTDVPQDPQPALLDTANIDPWKARLDLGDVDLDTMVDRKMKKTFELSRSRKMGQCDRCHGNKVDVCRRCKASTPDECWWCKGKGNTGGVTCKQCTGAGVMSCKACNGTSAMPCGSCQGEGKGMFAAFLQVVLTRVDLDPLPLSSIMRGQEENSSEAHIQTACSDKARDMVTSLLVALAQDEDRNQERKKCRHHRPHRVFASLHHSNSHLVELETPKAARVVTHKKSAPSLQPSSFFQRKIQRASFYFVLPSDPDLSLVQLSIEELDATLKALDGKEKIRSYRGNGNQGLEAVTSCIDSPIQLDLPSLPSTRATTPLSLPLEFFTASPS